MFPAKHAMSLLNLPPSLPNMKNLSPQLWAWVNSVPNDPFSTEETKTARVFSPAGEEILDLPAHLLPTVRTKSVAARSLRQIEAYSRKPVPSIENLMAIHSTTKENEPQFKRFFVLIKDLELKDIKMGEEVICVIGTGDQKRCTSILPISREPAIPRGTNYVAQSMEGFLLYSLL